MSEKRIRRRELLTGIAAVGVTAAGAGTGTYAYISDESQSDITINVGSLDLNNPAPIEWSENPDSDGEDSFSDSVTIDNAGNLPARRVILSDVSVNDGALAKALEITDVRYGVASSTPILGDIEANNNGNGLYDLDDLRQSTPIDLSEVAGSEVLHADDDAVLEIDAKFDYAKIPDAKGGAALEAT